MKERIIFIAAASALVLAAACSKQEATLQDEPVIANLITISASLDEADTKAEVNSDGDFSWTMTTDRVAYHTTSGYLASGGANASAATADFGIDGSAFRDAFAIYPHTLVWNPSTSEAYANSAADYGQTGHGLVVNLPATYTLAQVTGNVSPCPMIASNSGDSWSFRQLCGVLRLKVNSIPPSANKITVDFNGKKVSGAFTVAAGVTPGTSVIATNDGTDSEADVITITFDSANSLDPSDPNYQKWRDGVLVNLPLPVSPDGAGYKYGDITVKVWNGSTELLSITRGVQMGTTYAMARAAGKKSTVSFPVFSVSDNTRVIIAQSNLAYLGATGGDKKWRLLQDPWSIIEDTRNNSTLPDNAASNTDFALFSWACSGYDTYYPAWQRIKSNTYYDFGVTQGSVTGGASWTTVDARYDWGVYNTVYDYTGTSALTGTWRVLTGGPGQEAEYLVGYVSGSPASSHIRYNKSGRGTVNGCLGAIFVPDYFVDPKQNGASGTGAFRGGFQSYTVVDYDKNIYTSVQWEKMKQAGAIFIPAAGYAYKGTVTCGEATTSSYGPQVMLWTSSAYNSGHSHLLWIDHGRCLPILYLPRPYALSVRLVQEIN